MAHECILIVDDSLPNLQLMRILLQREGYLIQTASEGNEALSILNTFKPQLVLMDIQLPGIDGLEVTRRIKANPDTRSIIVVALTASATKGDEEKVRSAGCDGYIKKPFETQKLLLSIRTYLGAANWRNNRPKNQDIKALLPSVNAALTEEAPILKAELESLARITHEFLIEGEQQSRRLCDELKIGIDIPAARQLMSQWAATGGTLGFPQISQAAFAIDTVLEFSPSNIEIIEKLFAQLPKLFSDALAGCCKIP